MKKNGFLSESDLQHHPEQRTKAFHPENDPSYRGLKVNSGVAAPPSINPYRRPRRQQRPSTEELIKGILDGSITLLSRAVTLIESQLARDRKEAQKIIEACLPYAGKSMRIGITGVPGSGKSTSIDTFGMHLIKQGHRLAVLAIDPSSEVSKGSILGDKTRMADLSREKRAFIRPSPAGDSLGGVARKTRETIILCEAAGFDTIFVETVGVGQSETVVHSMVDFFLLIQLAGTGDELQGIKRGIMEMADGIVINKADGDNVEKAQLAASHYRNALHLFPPTESGWEPKVLTYSGYYGIGIKEIFDMIDRYRMQAIHSGYFEKKRKEQTKWWLQEAINDALRRSFYENEAIKGITQEVEEAVLHDQITPFVGAAKLLDAYFKSHTTK